MEIEEEKKKQDLDEQMQPFISDNPVVKTTSLNNVEVPNYIFE